IEWLDTLDLKRAENFWREQLCGFTSPTPLPLARMLPDTSVSNDTPGELAFRLPAATTDQLRSVAEKYDVTLNTLVQAAWAVVLSRYSGEDEVVFGALRAGRKIPVEGAQSTIGLFIN